MILKAELLKEYVMSLKKVVCKDRQVEIECNSESTSEANNVHLKGNFLFLISFIVTRNNFFLTNVELLFSISD